MFIGHLPFGYLTTRAWEQAAGGGPSPAGGRLLLWIALLASVLPDFDLLYFFLWDQHQHLHHGYWTHQPWFLLAVALLFLTPGWIEGKPLWTRGALLAGLNLQGHLLLDTFVGKIRWLAPFSNRDFYFFDVPARHGWWVWNFVFHWTFLFELALVGLAGWLWWWRRSGSGA